MKKVLKHDLELLYSVYVALNSAMIARNFYDDIEDLQTNELKNETIEFENIASNLFEKHHNCFVKKYNINDSKCCIIDLIINDIYSDENFIRAFCDEFMCEVED